MKLSSETRDVIRGNLTREWYDSLKDYENLPCMKEQQAFDKKLEEMKATVDKARQDITKETDPNKIAQLEEKYRNDINNQKLALDNEYNTKLKQIDTNIKSIVVTKAKEMKYNLVLPKSIVLFGGDDITAEVAKSVK